MSRTIVIGSDHGGFAMKQALVQKLKEWGYEVDDQGPASAESCDYPVFAGKVAERVGKDVLGILICGTGQGMAMTANRYPNVRAAVCTNEFMANQARAHNDANILCLGERVIGLGVAESVLKAFLDTEFEGGRHQRRVDLIDTISK